MATGADADEFMLLSKVRTGLKREFAFAFKSQNEIACSLGRTRTRTPASGVDGVQQSPSSKRFKQSGPVSSSNAHVVQESVACGDLKSDVVDAASDDDNQSHHFASVDTEDAVGELSSNSLVEMIPKKLKDLLDTGLLEGLSVRYSRRAKCKLPKETDLRGVVKGSGILCFCEDCKGETVVTPSVFEVHAGSANKRPSDYIYLENGNTFRDVLNACKDCDLDDVEVTITNAIGNATEAETAYCIYCEGSISVAGKRNAKELCDACMALKSYEKSPKRVTEASSDSPQENLLHRLSDNAKKSVSSGNKCDGRLTRKDLRLHKLVFEGDVLPDGTEVGYYVHGKKMLSGYKQGSGIFCMCCLKEVSPSQFEAHAGWASIRKPYLHIYISNGVSLHELSLSLSKTRKLSCEDNDDLCSICLQHGYLLCCDGCPRAFHQECIPLVEVPDGDWYCRHCENMSQREKYAECNANAIAAGRVAGVDPIEQIKRRCIRIMKPQESESSGCALCRTHDFAKGGFSCRTVMLCDQCEREFHVGCLQDHGMQDLKELPEGKWFCCSGCNRISSALQQMIEDGEQQIPDCILNIIKQKHEENGSEDVKVDIKWRLLNGKMSSIASTRVLLSEAVSVFHEQFNPIVLPDSNQDIIPHMVYGRNAKGRELGGMYCAILTVDSVIVSAGVFRIFGKDIAELPLVATSSKCEKLGYFRLLYSCIEKLLGELDVNYLWLPAAAEAKPLWTNKFGFSDFPTDEFVELKKQYSLMIFDGTIALRKSVPKKNDASVIHACAIQGTNIPQNHMEATGRASTDGAVLVLIDSNDDGLHTDLSQNHMVAGGRASTDGAVLVLVDSDDDVGLHIDLSQNHMEATGRTSTDGVALVLINSDDDDDGGLHTNLSQDGAMSASGRSQDLEMEAPGMLKADEIRAAASGESDVNVYGESLGYYDLLASGVSLGNNAVEDSTECGAVQASCGKP